MTRLTLRRLRAMETALSAMLAGCEGEGDWPEDLPAADLEAAHEWVCQQIERRSPPRGFTEWEHEPDEFDMDAKAGAQSRPTPFRRSGDGVAV